MATHSSVLALDRGAWQATVHGVTESQTWLSNWTTTKNFTLRSSLKEQMLPFLDMLSWRDPWGCPGLSWLYKSNARERRHSWWNVQFVLSIDFQNKVKFFCLFLCVSVFLTKEISNWYMKDFLRKHLLGSLEKRDNCSHKIFHIWFIFVLIEGYSFTVSW